MPFWQLTAGLLAVLFVFIGAVAFVRFPRPLMLVTLVLILAIPTLALGTYALAPGPVPQLGALLWLAFIPALAGLAAGAWMLAWMAQRRDSLNLSQIELMSNGLLVAFGGLVLALSDVVALWQPWFAVANLLLNMGWAAVWIPRRPRESNTESSVDIYASRSRVYEFIADPLNWPRYQEGLVSVAVQPPGALAVGSVVKVKSRYESHVRGPRMLPDVIETTSTTTAVEPGRSISMQIADRPSSTASTAFEDAGGGTRITTRASTLAPYRLAVFGALIELRSQRGERLARAQRNLSRLKEILEQEPGPTL